MLNWFNLSRQQKLAGTFCLALCLVVIVAASLYTPPERTPPIGMPLMALGWLLHPAPFAKGKRTVAWRGAPLLVKIVWAAGITALIVSVTAGVGRMLA
ncbi:hypothetical protein [Janthinobacterium sp. UMAB-56]|uniref:hypothetical protein n=1 Tax=Janthinobacterium sp. UMAB-56 TaxID=1365361 RepID=UPI001C583B6B|nr:hypothetical protein [Janthinobacterium sp. UMAB-56]